MRTFAYDTSGRLTTETDATGRVKTYVYTGTSANPTSIVDGTGVEATTMSRAYDAHGNISSKSVVTSTGTLTTSYTYDTFDEPVSTTSPEGRETEYTYDANGNKTAIQNVADAS